MSRSRLLLLIALVAAIGAFFTLGLDQYLSLAFFKSQQQSLNARFLAEPLFIGGAFFITYVLITGLSLPGAVPMTLAAGAIFGLFWGTLIVSFASSLGATLAFLASRFLFRESIQKRYGQRLKTINQGIERDGAFYLFALRLVPVFPFFMINLLMGLSVIRTLTFYWASQLGMLAGTLVYVNAGTQLAAIDGLSGILSPGLLAAFALLATLPVLARAILAGINARRVYRPWRGQKPKRFDYNLIVIGAGAAGLVSAYIAAAVKAKVALIEKDKMGGDCLNTGCVPSKALLRTARFVQQARRAESLGLKGVRVDHRFSDIMARVQRVIRSIEPHDSVARYTELGVDCRQGTARITTPWNVQITQASGKQETLSTRNIIIATGGRPSLPPIPGIEDAEPLTSDTVWSLDTLPERLLVIGGGPIGCELAQAFQRLGSKVTLVQRGARLLPKEDPDISSLLAEALRDEGMDLRLSATPERFAKDADGHHLVIRENDQAQSIHFDRLLVATGRKANTKGFGLEELGITPDEGGTVEVDETMRTRLPNIYACGDVAGPYQFTHTAAHTAWYASVNALFGRFKRFKADFTVIPWATFTEPEVARVGLNEQDAKAADIAYEVTTYGIDDLDRAITDEAAQGMVKVLTEPGKDRILGVTIVGEHAGDIIAEYVLAMRHGLGLNKILGTIHIYPTLAEANKYAAGNWKRAHAPERLLDWVRRFHSWMRG